MHYPFGSQPVITQVLNLEPFNFAFPLLTSPQEGTDQLQALFWELPWEPIVSLLPYTYNFTKQASLLVAVVEKILRIYRKD